MTLTTRLATPADAMAMTRILNDIIKTGGTTAHETPYSPEKIFTDYICNKHGISCVIAEISNALVGFQSIERPYPGGNSFPDNWAIIATFVKQGQIGAGIGTALFQTTRNIAKKAGIAAIDATIRADNAGGLRYYSKMGFVDYKLTSNVPLTDGTPVDRISKRLDL